MNLEKLYVWLTITKNLTLHFNRISNYKRCRFLTDRQTLLIIKEEKKGISRFGDGELSYLSGYSFLHQKQDVDLRKKLIEILENYHESSPYLVGLPYDILFNQHQKRNLPKTVWNSAKYSLFPYVRQKRTYGSAFCFRILAVLDEDKKEYAKLLLSIFKGKDIIYVGSGEPFPGLIQVKAFIRTPPADAFGEYHQLIATIQDKVKTFKNPGVLLSCGITATALSADLNNMGILSYDVGLCFTRRLAAYFC
jgi:hypothetical protein